jgi:hypothetical protein
MLNQLFEELEESEYDSRSLHDYNTVQGPAAMAFDIKRTRERIESVVKKWHADIKKKESPDVPLSEIRNLTKDMRRIRRELVEILNKVIRVDIA